MNLRIDVPRAPSSPPPIPLDIPITEWEGLGPFPAGMREHPFLASPLHAYGAVPLNTADSSNAAVDPDPDPDVAFAAARYGSLSPPTPYVTGGRALWRRFTPEAQRVVEPRGEDKDENGHVEPAPEPVVKVSFPGDWEALRADHGWASVQYSALLRSRIEIPSHGGAERTRVRVDGGGCVEYAFVPVGNSTRAGERVPLDRSAPWVAQRKAPVWYSGDVYGFADTPAGRARAGNAVRRNPDDVSNFSRALSLEPGKYVVLVRALYEVRLFGDPGTAEPTISLKFRIAQELAHLQGVDVCAIPQVICEAGGAMPDVVDGWFMGQWASVAVCVPPPPSDRLPRWMKVQAIVYPGSEAMAITAIDLNEALMMSPEGGVWIAEGQTRMVPLQNLQTQPLPAGIDSVRIEVNSHEEAHTAFHSSTICSPRGRDLIQVRVRRRDSADGEPFRMTLASPFPSMPPVPRTNPHGRPSIASVAPASVSVAVIVPPPRDDSECRCERRDAGAQDAGGAIPDTLFPPPLDGKPPVLLALHGAGVDVESSFWVDALPRVRGMWSVLPSGRNEWGEDWHGGSAADVWAARDAFARVVHLFGAEPPSDETLLLGHSNGGQGAWYAAMRYPDRIRGVIAIAGFLKIDEYVPYTETTASHYADPSLLGILNASLAPYANDLHASNLASVPVLALHGARDDNVPPRHGRAHLSILSSWLHAAAPRNVRFVEVPLMGHWWDGVLRHAAVGEFIRTLPRKASAAAVRATGFTLATACPDECGAKGAIRIIELAVPGRLARLDVNAPQWRRAGGELSLHGMNVRRIAITGWAGGGDGEAGAVPDGASAETVLLRHAGQWIPEPQPPTPVAVTGGPVPLPPTRAYGPMIRLLASNGPLSIVVPDASPTQPPWRGNDGGEREREAAAGPTEAQRALYDLALAYAHDVRVHHRLDARIVAAGTALREVAAGTLGSGNVVVLGRPDENRFAAWLVAQERTPVRFPTRSILSVAGRVVWEHGTGIIALHPHPLDGRGLAVLVAGNDGAGLARAARLLPRRTGVPVPDWAVVTARCDWQGAGGLAGAGWWRGDWGWSDEMCWMDRE